MEASTDTRTDGGSAERIAENAGEIKREYARGEDRPIGSHLALVVVYNGLVGAFLAARARTGRGFPKRIGIGDLLLAGVATPSGDQRGGLAVADQAVVRDGWIFLRHG